MKTQIVDINVIFHDGMERIDSPDLADESTAPLRDSPHLSQSNHFRNELKVKPAVNQIMDLLRF